MAAKTKLWIPTESGETMTDEAIRATPVYRQLRKQLSVPYTGKGKAPEQPDAERMLLRAAAAAITQLYHIWCNPLACDIFPEREDE